MFEHLRNYREIFDRVGAWLKPEGRFFMHIFCHKTIPYFFEDNDGSDWMSRHFFSGGMMPSADLPLKFQDSLCFERRWDWSGVEYQKTSEAWLNKLDAAHDDVFNIFSETLWESKREDVGEPLARIFYGMCRVIRNARRR
jgi:cyclopropane-fatty-acyl-phospholipid synthase